MPQFPAYPEANSIQNNDPNAKTPTTQANEHRISITLS